jgi:serine/threonine protein kinase
MIDHIHALPEGYRLQEYKIIDSLGFGGFGITYSGLDTNLDKIVAIKEYLPSELAVRVDGATISAKSDQDKESFDWGLERFLDEAKTVARFDHNNIVRIYRFFEQNGTGYIVMEFIDGMTLDSLLREHGVLSEPEIRRWLWPIMRGLKIVHEHGFLHRDIKPQNIMMRENGRPCLLDFGAARLAMGGRTRSLTSIMTPGFAPLEQYQTKGQGPWTDIYALAAVMYKCISGAKPQDVLDRVTDDSLESPDKNSEMTYSPGLIKGISSALAMSASERPQDLDSWLEMLDQPVNDLTRRVDTPPKSVSPKSTPTSPPAKTNPTKKLPDKPRKTRLTVPAKQQPGGDTPPGASAGTAPIPSPSLGIQKAKSIKSVVLRKWVLLGVLPLLVVMLTIYWWPDASQDRLVETPSSSRAAGGKTEPASLTTSFTVTSTPANASVYVENDYVGNTPVVITKDLSLFAQNIEVIKDGYLPKRHRVYKHSGAASWNAVLSPADGEGGGPGASANSISPTQAGTGDPSPTVRYAIHLETFNSRDQADRFAQGLRRISLPVIIEPWGPSGAEIYRVRAGPFDSREEADHASGRLQDELSTTYARLIELPQ